MKRRLKSSEHDEQAAVVQYWAHACGTYGLPPYALLAIPNANKLLRMAKNSYALAAYMRAEGLQPGALDLFLAVPHGGLGGLWLELKIKPNKPSEPQEKMISYLECGYRVKVAYSADEAITEIKQYLEGKT